MEEISEITLQGETYKIAGSGGESGATFIPSVSQEGIISWTNDKKLPNPEPVNIKGPKGDTGSQGPQGEPGVYTETVVTMTMYANEWTNGVYSFENDYPHESYNVEIEPNGSSITSDQYDAWCNAKLVGMSNVNSCKALGDVPSVNIPIILRAVNV